MKELIEKIDGEIERKIMEKGLRGTDQVKVTLCLTNEEKELFSEIDKYDNGHYWWEFDGNELYISYTEDVLA